MLLTKLAWRNQVNALGLQPSSLPRDWGFETFAISESPPASVNKISKINCGKSVVLLNRPLMFRYCGTVADAKGINAIERITNEVNSKEVNLNILKPQIIEVALWKTS